MGTIQRGYLGTAPIEAMTQSSVEVTPLHSRYTLNGGGVELEGYILYSAVSIRLGRNVASSDLSQLERALY